jgi:hypothetical protein
MQAEFRILKTYLVKTSQFIYMKIYEDAFSRSSNGCHYYNTTAYVYLDQGRAKALRVLRWK